MFFQTCASFQNKIFFFFEKKYWITSSNKVHKSHVFPLKTLQTHLHILNPNKFLHQPNLRKIPSSIAYYSNFGLLHLEQSRRMCATQTRPAATTDVKTMLCSNNNSLDKIYFLDNKCIAIFVMLVTLFTHSMNHTCQAQRVYSLNQKFRKRGSWIVSFIFQQLI